MSKMIFDVEAALVAITEKACEGQSDKVKRLFKQSAEFTLQMRLESPGGAINAFAQITEWLVWENISAEQFLSLQEDDKTNE